MSSRYHRYFAVVAARNGRFVVGGLFDQVRGDRSRASDSRVLQELDHLQPEMSVSAGALFRLTSQIMADTNLRRK